MSYQFDPTAIASLGSYGAPAAPSGFQLGGVPVPVTDIQQSALSSGAGLGQGGTSLWESMLGKNGQGGWGGLALGGISALGNAWMGMKQYGLAKDSLKEQQRQYNQNFSAQRQLVNSQLEDRQRARVASNPGAYQSVGEYMDKNGVK